MTTGVIPVPAERFISRTIDAPAEPAPMTATREADRSILRRQPNSRDWNRTNPMNIVATTAPNNATERGTGNGCSGLIRKMRAPALSPASTTRRASATLACRQICP